MRGNDQQQGHVFSYISPEQRVRKDHPLRPIRTMVDKVLKELSPEFDKMYSKVGRPSIPPEQLLRALLLQMLYSVRSERLLVDEEVAAPSIVARRGTRAMRSVRRRGSAIEECFGGLKTIALLRKVRHRGTSARMHLSFPEATWNALDRLTADKSVRHKRGPVVPGRLAACVHVSP